MLIQIYQEIHGNTTEMNQLSTIMAISLIFLLLTIIVIHLNLNRKIQKKQETAAQVIFWRTLEMPLMIVKLLFS